jgi:serine/threonine-protein kinase
MDHEERLKAALADRYQIEREIGSGGMATVYLAQDLKHNRQVAVKVLSPELSESLGTERFLREIQTAAYLTHPHILPLFDSGEAGGFLYYVMPFVEGESLRSRLTKEKQLPIEDAIQIAREIADALAYAHEKGVIHRDVKPANIMLEAGHAVLADFGVAHAVAEAKGERITRTGTSLGTPAYMSPEQASGEQDLDGRSDQYALGCVLYEMLAGHPPFRGAQVETVIRKHLAEEPPSVTQARTTVAEEVAEVIKRALAKSPADRFRTTGDLMVALGPTTGQVKPAAEGGRRSVRIALGVTAVVLIGVLGTMVVRPSGEHSPNTVATSDNELPGIAVLPCENWSPDPEDAYFASGIHEEILLSLSKLSTLRSVGRESVEWYRNHPQPMSQMAQELSVGFVGECSVRKDREGNLVRLTFQLLDGQTGENLWAQSYDQTLSARSIFEIQTDIARRVAQAVGAVMTPEDEVRIASLPTESTEAYQLYLQGKFWLPGRTEDGYRRAVEYFSDALELDPTFALGYSGLADAYVIAGWYGFLPSISEARDRALAAANRALALDEDLAPAHSALGRIAKHFDWDWNRAEPHYLRAVELAPTDPEILRNYGLALFHIGEFARAERMLRKAVASNPLYAMANYNLGDLLSTMGRASEAVALLQRNLEMYPDHRNTIYALQRALYLDARYEEAVELNPTAPNASYSLVALGRKAEVEDRVAAIESEGNRPSIHFLTALGDYDGALGVLEDEINERRPNLWWVSVDPLLKPLHPDPRWVEFVRELRAKG